MSVNDFGPNYGRASASSGRSLPGGYPSISGLFCRGLLSAAIGVTCIAASCAIIIVPTAAASGEEECTFDQQAQIRHDRALSWNSKNSTYMEDTRVHRIERGQETIEFSRRGCTHLGISIDYSVPAAGRAVSSDDVFRRVIALVREFGGGELVTAEEVATAIRKKEYSRHEGNGGITYFLGVEPGLVFEFGYAVRNGRLEIGVSYYF